ncbi:MAG TPA: S9 family peptidase, partial [Terriglobales bacterium]|nr:S9 family peptidase [Terriglobales bacterium]
RWSRPLLALLVAAAAIAPLATIARAELPPIAPRGVFFGNPVKANPQISPDGTLLGYLAPSDKGVLNVWIKTIGKDDDRMVTKDEKRGIRQYFFAEDGKTLLYLQDVGGNENFHLYAVPLAGGDARDLTPHEGVRAAGVDMDKKHPDELLVAMNMRDKRLFDMYRISLATGEEKLDTQNPGDVLGWDTDAEFQVRAAQAQNPQDGSTILRVRDAVDQPWRDLLTLPADENGAFVGFTADGKAAYVETSIGSDVTRLVKMDLGTGKEVETLATDPRCDVGGLVIQPDLHTVQAVGFNYLRNEWKVLDKSIAGDFAVLRKLNPGDFGITSRDRADDKWIVAYTNSDTQVKWYVYDRKTKKAAFLFGNQPALEKVQMAKMEGVVIPARDGLALPCYLVLPVGVPAKNLPFVLYIHGGPWARDNWGYNPTDQWLANRGYGVLNVNYRASTGFGKKFLHLGDRQWGGTMQDDLTDAAKWAVAKGYADPKRIAIMGGSYGGYATLAGVTFTPDLYACGVDIVGPSNLKTLLQSVPPYWAPMRKMWDLRMGEVDKDSVFNEKVSPLFHVDAIKVPLLIGQGQNDPRVNVRESEQIVAAMRAKSLPVEFVVYTDEGHGFARPENRLDFYGRAENFLAKHIGGRAQPFEDVPGSTATPK